MLPLEYKLIQVFLFLRQTEGAGEFALKSLSDDHVAHFVMRSSYYYLTIVVSWPDSWLWVRLCRNHAFDRFSQSFLEAYNTMDIEGIQVC